MSAELDASSLLLTGLSAVTTTLCVMARLLWVRSESCETDRIEMHGEIEKLKESIGTAKGTLISFERCPDSDCPFRTHAKEQAVR